jgi:hypothetical protein
MDGASVAADTSGAASAPSDTSTASTGAGETSTTGAPSGGAQTATQTSVPDSYEVVIDGQKQAVSRDELLRGYQRAAAANRRFEEAQKARREAEEMRSALAKDPWAALKQAGLDPDQIAQQRILEAIQREQMTPEQRALAEERGKREALEQQIKQREVAEQKAKVDSETQAHIQRFNQLIPQAMEQAGLPRDPEAARLVVQNLATMAKMGLQPDPTWAAADAYQTLTARYAPVFASMAQKNPGAFIQAIGPQALDAIQRHLIASKRGPTQQAPQTQAQTQRRPSVYTDREQWRRDMLGE